MVAGFWRKETAEGVCGIVSSSANRGKLGEEVREACLEESVNPPQDVHEDFLKGHRDLRLFVKGNGHEFLERHGVPHQLELMCGMPRSFRKERAALAP